jgi:hypothetical protein
LAVLEALDAPGWERTGRHGEHGELSVELYETHVAAFEDHGNLATSITQGLEDAQATLERLAAVGIDLRQVAGVLEAEGVAAFADSYDGLLALLQARADMASAP